MTVKQQVSRVLEELPDDCTLEDVQYRLYVIETVRRRLEAADEGEGIPQDEIEKHFDKWRVK